MIGYRTVKFVSAVKRDNESCSSIQDGLQQEFYPLRCDASQIGVHHSHGLDLQEGSHLKYRTERSALARHPPVYSDTLLNFLRAGRLVGMFASIIQRSPVRDKDCRFLIRKIVRQSLAGLLDNEAYRILIVKSGDAHQDIHALYFVDPHVNIFSERRRIFLYCHNRISLFV